MTLLFIGTTEIIAIGAVALLLFGGKKLPEMMRSMGKGVREFKDGMAEGTEAFKEEAQGKQQNQPQQPAAQSVQEASAPQTASDAQAPSASQPQA